MRRLFRFHAVLTLFLLGQAGFGATREVGPGQTFTTIQAAVNAAVAGDTINIHAGTYTENVTVGKAGLILQNNAGETPKLVGRIELNNTANVTVQGLEITGFGSLALALFGVHQDGGTGMTVRNCTIHNGFGAGVSSRNSTRITIVGNTIFGNQNGTAGIDADGIDVLSGHSTDGTYQNGVLIANNIIHDNHTDGIKIQGQYFTIQDNQIFNNIFTDWSAIHPDGIQFIAAPLDGFITVQHARVSGNMIRNQTQNIFLEGTVSGQASDCADVTIWNNVIYNELIVVNGVNMATLANSNIVIKFSRDVFVYNNTLGAAGNLDVFIQLGADGTIHVKNNIMKNPIGDGVFVQDANDIAPGELNYNQYQAAAGRSAVVFGSSFFATRAAFNAVFTAYEVNGRDGDPKINAFPSPKLQIGSPCIDVALTLAPMIAVDKIGVARPQASAWDIGAFEFMRPTPPLNLRSP